jgi:hypothetical protein
MIRDASRGEGEEEEENQERLKERKPKIHGDSRLLCWETMLKKWMNEVRDNKERER